MQKPSRKIEWLVWGGLALIIAGIGVAFVSSKFGNKPTKSLPVYGSVSPFILTNQLEKTVSLDDLQGRVWIADIIFTRCPLQCIRVTKRMVELQAALANEKSVQFVSLTADPVFDTPTVFKKYGERFGADPNRWFFLTGQKRDLYSLAMNGLKLAVDEKPTDDRESLDDLFIHSTKFVLVDQRGGIRGWFDGENPETNKEIIEAVKNLLREK